MLNPCSPTLQLKCYGHKAVYICEPTQNSNRHYVSVLHKLIATEICGDSTMKMLMRLRFVANFRFLFWSSTASTATFDKTPNTPMIVRATIMPYWGVDISRPIDVALSTTVVSLVGLHAFWNAVARVLKSTSRCGDEDTIMYVVVSWQTANTIRIITP